MILELKRDRNPQSRHNWGELYVDGILLGQTLEDPEREEKIHGDTAIPCGRYRVTITLSTRFKRPMPYIHDVPNFTGVRIHGGNTEADTLGCPLLGTVRTADGIRDCAGPNKRLMQYLESAAARREDVWLEVS